MRLVSRLACIAVLPAILTVGCASSTTAEPDPGKELLARFNPDGAAADAGLCVGATFNRRNAFPKGSDDDKKVTDLAAYWTMQVTDREKDAGRALNLMMSAGRLLEQVEAVSPDANATDEILRRCAASKEAKA